VPVERKPFSLGFRTNRRTGQSKGSVHRLGHQHQRKNERLLQGWGPENGNPGGPIRGVTNWGLNLEKTPMGRKNARRTTARLWEGNVSEGRRKQTEEGGGTETITGEEGRGSKPTTKRKEIIRGRKSNNTTKVRYNLEIHF